MKTQARYAVLAAVFLCCGSAAAADWNAARWQAVYTAVPSLPDSLEHAGHMIGAVKDSSGTLSLGIVDPALLTSHADIEAGLAAVQTSATATVQNGADGQALAKGGQAAGIDIARMQSAPAYAQQMQQKMASPALRK